MNKNRSIQKKSNIKKLRSAAFLDRDGTINFDKGYTYKFSEFKFRPHVIKGLKYLTKKKYLLFIITNQAGIAKGKFKISDLFKLNRQLLSHLEKKKIYITKIKFCPYHPNAVVKKYRKKTNYRKPGNLMIRDILKKWNINMKKSFMIGDKLSDKIAAKKSNLYFEYVDRNFFNQVKKIVIKKTNSY